MKDGRKYRQARENQRKDYENHTLHNQPLSESELDELGLWIESAGPLDEPATEAEEASRVMTAEEAGANSAHEMYMRNASEYEAYLRSHRIAACAMRTVASTTSRPRRKRGSGQAARRTGSKSSSDDGDGDGEASPPTTHAAPLLTYFSYTDLAQRWKTSPGTLRRIRCDHPQDLPPAVKLPGAKGPRWHIDDILALERAGHDNAPKLPGRGRPRNSKKGVRS